MLTEHQGGTEYHTLDEKVQIMKPTENNKVIGSK